MNGALYVLAAITCSTNCLRKEILHRKNVSEEMLFNVFFSSIARLRRCKRPCWFLHCQKGTILIFMGYEQCEIKIIANLTTQSWLITINMYQASDTSF
ncbi:uncharacterized protein LOC108204039 isoform X4 [Daucus carota subsp. sativus]|uniref:uncharacterized protein LOC108204039 isoform X4 n=1 Tax=Daucus carota subsp. sativus TaxID=79200 RepID=UPI003082FB16